MPVDFRKLRLLNAIALGIARARVKATHWRLGEAIIYVGARPGFPLSFKNQKSRGAREDDPNRLSLIAGVAPEGPQRLLAQWDDKDGVRLESIVTDVVVDAAVLLEQCYRDHCGSHYRWMLERRAADIEAARKAKLEAERQERERLAALEQTRISRLLGEADRLRQADAIRAYVAEVGRRPTNALDTGAYENWRRWALEQADRIDPVASGEFLKAIGEGG